MNAFARKTALAVTVAGFLGATGAMAQTTTHSGTSTMPSTATGQGTPSGQMGKSDSTMGMPSRTDSATSAWTRLSKNRGYVSKEDMAGMKDYDFDAADTNHHGKLTEAEFTKHWTKYSSDGRLK